MTPFTVKVIAEAIGETWIGSEDYIIEMHSC